MIRFGDFCRFEAYSIRIQRVFSPYAIRTYTRRGRSGPGQGGTVREIGAHAGCIRVGGGFCIPTPLRAPVLRWGEVLVISEHCVAGCEHFSDCDDEGAFVGFASGAQGLAESGELGLGLEDASGCGHAEGVAAVAGPMPCMPCSRAARAGLAC